MKSKVIIFLLTLFATQGFAQQAATNADGSIKFRGNVAIMVEGRSFTFKNGRFAKQSDDSAVSQTCTALNAFVIQKFQNMCFGIVNRDNDAFEKVKKLVNENRLEDYIDGLSVQAKAQGADYLFIVDYTTYTEEDKATQAYINTRLLNVENNVGYHYGYKSEVEKLSSDVEKMRQTVQKEIADFSKFMDETLFKVFPEQYFFASVKGKDAVLGASQPVGRILAEDKFYAFKFSKDEMIRGGKSSPVQILDMISTGSDAKLAEGKLHVKFDKAIGNSNDMVLFRNTSDPDLSGSAVMTFTYFGLKYSNDSKEGFLKNRINNAIYSAITRHRGMQLVEQEHLADLKKERELQKTEDFLDGHVVSQMKAAGAQYFIHLDNFKYQGSQVSFKMSVVSVEANKILRSVDVVSSVDNIENEMYKQICERALSPCCITKVNGKQLEVLTGWTLPEEGKCILVYIKPMINPVNNSVSYQNTEIAKVEVTEYHGNKSVLKVNDILSKEDFTDLETKSKNGQLIIKMDGSDIKSSDSEISDVEKTAHKKERK